MKKSAWRLTRGQWRVWLHGLIISGALQKIPPGHDLDGSASARPAAEVAEELLAALRDPELSQKALAQLMAEVKQFRNWVESQQKRGRQIILAERETERADPLWLELWTTRATDARRREPTQSPPGPTPRRHPMWDEILDE
jgi:hypothetical protein